MKPHQLAFELCVANSNDSVPHSLHLEPNPAFGRFCDLAKDPKAVDAAYALSITAGKNTYVYDAHTYHTKVPPQGIQLLVDYYTNPGDVVLDPFCGSGMAGVAATNIGRKALLSDLSPAAAFIAHNLNTPIDSGRYMNAVQELIARQHELEKELYTTHCRTCGKETVLLYTVWSYGLTCNACAKEFILWDVARDERDNVRESKILAEFDCPHCRQHIKKRGLVRTRRYPVSVGYHCCGSGLKEATAPPDEFDLSVLSKLDDTGLPDGLWHPTDRFPDGVNTRQPIAAGVTSVDKAYTPRALYAMASLWKAASDWPDAHVREKLLFTLTSLYQRVTVFSEFRFWGGSGNTANYNVPAIMNEQNVFRTFLRKAGTISWYFRESAHVKREVEIAAQSACNLQFLPDKSVDYIFTDPPFGANINYSEMNFLWESWLQAKTDNAEEAIVNKAQGKGYDEYQELLRRAFCEMRRVLKDSAWLTVVFHNSSEKAWKSIQRGLDEAGFSIEGTQTFDKEHGTFKMFVSDNAVGYDLVLHCRKSTCKSVNLGEQPAGDVAGSVRGFVGQALLGGAESYVVHYLHVSREDEFDYRKLYAGWLSETLSKQLISLSFDEFRVIVDEEREAILKARDLVLS